jgi:hypothetical protein
MFPTRKGKYDVVLLDMKSFSLSRSLFDRICSDNVIVGLLNLANRSGRYGNCMSMMEREAFFPDIFYNSRAFLVVNADLYALESTRE